MKNIKRYNEPKMQPGTLISFESVFDKNMLMYLKQELNNVDSNIFQETHPYIITFLGSDGKNVRFFCEHTIDSLYFQGLIKIKCG